MISVSLAILFATSELPARAGACGLPQCVVIISNLLSSGFFIHGTHVTRGTRPSACLPVNAPSTKKWKARCREGNDSVGSNTLIYERIQSFGNVSAMVFCESDFFILSQYQESPNTSVPSSWTHGPSTFQLPHGLAEKFIM